MLAPQDHWNHGQTARSVSPPPPEEGVQAEAAEQHDGKAEAHPGLDGIGDAGAAALGRCLFIHGGIVRRTARGIATCRT